MPREIKTTIAVDGEAAFKRAINEANTSIRNLGSELSLATAQFKKDGDAMKLMESRSKTLKSEIGQQEEIVKALEQAVKDSAAAFGENSTKTEKWEAELNRAKARLVNLQSELTLNDAGLDRNGKAFDDSSEKAADYQATLQTIGRGVSFENISSGIGRITSGFENAIRKVFSFAKAMRDTMVDAGHWADDLMTDATKYNMDVEELQRWRNAADFIDTDVDTIVTARDRLSRKMAEGWSKGSGKEKKDMWELLGIDLHDGETGQMRDQMDVMFELGETLRSMVTIDGNDVRASELSMEVFGKSYRDLLPLFAAGQAEWNKTVANQRVVSKEHVEALGAMDDANNELQNSWETLKYTALSEIAPVMTDAATALSGLLNEFNDWMSTEEGQKEMDGLAEALRELFGGLGDIKFKDAIETAKNGLNDLKSGLEWMKDHKDDVETALKVIAGGFGLLKVTQLAVDIGKIASGFKTIFSFSGKKAPTLPSVGGAPTAGGGSNGLYAKIGSFLQSPTVKIASASLIFLGTLFKNAIAEQGNDDILDDEGELTESAKESGFYKDESGTIKNTRTEPRVWEVAPKTEPETPEEILKTIGGELSEAQRAAAEEWWDSFRQDPMGDEGDEKWEALEASFSGNEELLTRLSDAIDNWLTSPENEDDSFLNNSDLLSQAVQEMKTNTESGKTMADKVAGADIKRFNGLPALIEAAAQRGTAAGVSRITVQLDGHTFGRLVAPYVNTELGSYFS